MQLYTHPQNIEVPVRKYTDTLDSTKKTDFVRKYLPNSYPQLNLNVLDSKNIF